MDRVQKEKRDVCKEREKTARLQGATDRQTTDCALFMMKTHRHPEQERTS